MRCAKVGVYAIERFGDNVARAFVTADVVIRLRRGLCLALLLCIATASAEQRDNAPRRNSSFASLVGELSEPPGYFDTDNLISNERSYLHVIPDLRALAGGGRGVYVGVGPDQNFSYIAHLRPSLAIVVDIRHDNLLLHLLFKALFAEAQTRLAYLAMLTGRPAPVDADKKERSLDEIVGYIDRTPALGDADLRALRARLTRVIDSFGVPLTESDRATIDRFHQRFVAAGLSLQFNTFGRQPQYDYPTFRELLLETDRQGVRRSYLASEEDFQFVKRLHAEHRIVPVVGDLSGRAALAAVARFLTQANLQVAAFYTSNVEFYLFREGRFAEFIANLRRLPRRPGAAIVRSVFRSGGTLPGYNSASLTQPIDVLINGYASGRIRDYRDLAR
jgi:hypothetical protein